MSRSGRSCFSRASITLNIGLAWAVVTPITEAHGRQADFDFATGKNLYATGGAWHVGSNAGSTEAYNCYRIIAKDLGLAKPWEEPGKEEPDSLVEQLKIVNKRVQASARR